jgi:hypothetical protein
MGLSFTTVTTMLPHMTLVLISSRKLTQECFKKAVIFHHNEPLFIWFYGAQAQLRSYSAKTGKMIFG